MPGPAPKKLVLHIGSHKTATTYVQSTLAANPDVLGAMSVLYPKAGRIYDAHFRLGWKLRAPELADTALEDIDEWAAVIAEIQASDAEIAILSSEEFGLFTDPARLAPLRRHFDVTVIAYLRSPDSYLESFYNQFVKDFVTRETRTLATYIAEQNLFFLEIRRILEPWREIFGTGAIRLRPFDAALTEKGIVTDFFETIGFRDMPALAEPGSGILQKVSLPPDALEYLRFANAGLDREEGHHAFVVQLVKMAQAQRGRLDSTRAGILSLKARQNLRRRFAGAYGWAARTFLNSDRTPFAPMDAPPPPADFHSRPEEADARTLGRVAAMIQNHLAGERAAGR